MQRIMVVNEQPLLRRSSRRGDQAPNTAPVTETQPQSMVTLSHRTKRNRLSSISEAESQRKKRKTEHFGYPSNYQFPLRNRPNNEPLRSLPFKNGTKPVLSGHERKTTAVYIPKQKQTSQIVSPEYRKQQYTSQFNDKRTLRSQDGGSRSKSELSLYFTNYEQMLSLEHPEPGKHIADTSLPSPSLIIVDLLGAKTHITLIDDLSILSEERSSPLPSLILKSEDPDPFGAQKPLHNAQRIELNSALPLHSPRRLIRDTLSEDVFYKAHRKAERHERQLRNIEKERAQHEKVQLDRLLEELKGPDWLKVMGISGVTESEKKLYEPKRVFFIREVAGLIEKFRHWKEEEKRRKIEREQALLAEGEEDEHFGSLNDEDVSNSSGHQPSSSTLPASPDTGDVDAAAARQLQQEAISASSSSSTKARTNRPPNGSSNPYPSRTDLPTHIEQSSSASSTAKNHRRDVAVTGHRHHCSTIAFGQPVPDLEEQDFELPATILTKDMVRARARLRRRLKRGSPA